MRNILLFNTIRIVVLTVCMVIATETSNVWTIRICIALSSLVWSIIGFIEGRHSKDNTY